MNRRLHSAGHCGFHSNCVNRHQTVCLVFPQSAYLMLMLLYTRETIARVKKLVVLLSGNICFGVGTILCIKRGLKKKILCFCDHDYNVALAYKLQKSRRFCSGSCWLTFVFVAVLL